MTQYKKTALLFLSLLAFVPLQGTKKKNKTKISATALALKQRHMEEQKNNRDAEDHRILDAAIALANRERANLDIPIPQPIQIAQIAPNENHVSLLPYPVSILMLCAAIYSLQALLNTPADA